MIMKSSMPSVLTPKVRQIIHPKDLVLYYTELSPFNFTLMRLLL
mgnify:CR=1 FL=1